MRGAADTGAAARRGWFGSNIIRGGGSGCTWRASSRGPFSSSYCGRNKWCRGWGGGPRCRGNRGPTRGTSYGGHSGGGPSGGGTNGCGDGPVRCLAWGNELLRTGSRGSSRSSTLLATVRLAWVFRSGVRPGTFGHHIWSPTGSCRSWWAPVSLRSARWRWTRCTSSTRFGGRRDGPIGCTPARGGRG